MGVMRKEGWGVESQGGVSRLHPRFDCTVLTSALLAARGCERFAFDLAIACCRRGDKPLISTRVVKCISSRPTQLGSNLAMQHSGLLLQQKGVVTRGMTPAGLGQLRVQPARLCTCRASQRDTASRAMATDQQAGTVATTSGRHEGADTASEYSKVRNRQWRKTATLKAHRFQVIEIEEKERPLGASDSTVPCHSFALHKLLRRRARPSLSRATWYASPTDARWTLQRNIWHCQRASTRCWTRSE